MKSFSKVVSILVLFGTTSIISACNEPAQNNDENERTTEARTTQANDDNAIQFLDDSDSNSDNNDDMTSSSRSTSLTNETLLVEDKMINDLTRYRWVLADASDDSGQPLTSLIDIKDQVMTSFIQRQGKNTLNYSVGCNTMSAGYELKGRVLTIENSMSTKMSCADLDLVENRLNDLMQGVNQIELVKNTADDAILTQITDNSVTIQWRGKLTAKAKYGSKGETVFWAVDAQSRPCSTHSMQTCLQVRPISYDDQGIKVSEGKQIEFAGTIDGYEHNEEFDEVLRLQRYKLNSATSNNATSSAERPLSDDHINNKYAYVLDTIIEQTAVK